MREALFSILGPIDGVSVLDLYAGSGALGLEALSRGARRCTFADSHAAACRAIKANLASLGMTGALVLQRDALSVLRDEAHAGRTHELVLLDPPYGDWEGLAERLGASIPPVVAPGGKVVVETGAKVEPTLPLDLVTTRRYGSARITIFTT